MMFARLTRQNSVMTCVWARQKPAGHSGTIMAILSDDILALGRPLIYL
jgi:hypothetical protein